ncbi:hypothetical protein NQ317_010516 [Molorchus minor]|uniref:C-type lectin domain-containing protein n=1 Tax=Molorchus minor TaxID=1323400 RepID=A0ABQ9JPT1_9CUCU|nr:hypothetical protein NQ317_010516 [Molorchus minor]
MMPRIRLFCCCFYCCQYYYDLLGGRRRFNAIHLSGLAKKKNELFEFCWGRRIIFGTVFRANFYRAMQFCRQQGMQLVSIQSKAENDRLGRFAEEIGAPHGHYWLSGTNLAEENQWIWLSTGNNFVYSNWHPGEPSGTGSSNTSENCVEARHWGKGFTWNDLRCNAELNFICETLESCS